VNAVRRICHDAEPMPSPIGHALAGVATAWSSEYFPAANAGDARASARLTFVCAALAALPDVDLLFPGTHRTVTHSISATIFVTIIAAAVTGWVTRSKALNREGDSEGNSEGNSEGDSAGTPRRSRAVWRIALVCGIAYGSHLLLDWLGADPNPPSGIEALWPFSHQWFISPWTVFPGTERRHFFTLAAVATNLRALAVEVGVLGPVVGVLGRKSGRWVGWGRIVG
jgi:inner membrane protein